MDNSLIFNNREKPTTLSFPLINTIDERKSLTIKKSNNLDMMLIKEFDNLNQMVRKIESHLNLDEKINMFNFMSKNDSRKKITLSEDTPSNLKQMFESSSINMKDNMNNDLRFTFLNKGISIKKKKLFEKKKSNFYINNIINSNYFKSPSGTEFIDHSSTVLNGLPDIKFNNIKSITSMTMTKNEQENIRIINELKTKIKKKDQIKEDIMNHVYKNISEKSKKINPDREEKLVDQIIGKKLFERKEKTAKSREKKTILKDNNYVEFNHKNDIDKIKEIDKKISTIKEKKMKVSLFKKRKNSTLGHIIWVVIAIFRMKILSKAKFDKILFTRIFETFPLQNEKLTYFIYNSIKVAYLSIANFENLKLDISEEGSFFRCSESERKDKFIKLSTRLTTFLDNLIDNTEKTKMDSDLIEFINNLSSKRNITKEMLTNFELSRLEFSSEGILV